MPPSRSRERFISAVKKLGRAATRWTITPAGRRALAPSQARFGGDSALGDAWPTCARCDEPSSFVCQLGPRELAASRTKRHVVLFACWRCMDAGSSDEGPPVYVIRSWTAAPVGRLERPRAAPRTKPFVVAAAGDAMTLPSELDASLRAWAAELDPEEPWEPELEARPSLDALRPYDAHAGGHPTWFHPQDVPACVRCGAPMRFLFQVYSEQVGLLERMGRGSLYAFMCGRHPTSTRLERQYE
jgi:hypothetical protein